MRTILIVGGIAAKSCRDIAPPLRKLGRGQVSCYFESELVKLLQGEIDWQNIAFVLIGLSGDSSNKDSDIFKIEQKIFKYALDNGIPFGIVRDEYGRVTAPHLVEGVTDMISLVVANELNMGCELGGLYPKAQIIIAGQSGVLDADVIAKAIAKVLPEQKFIGEGISHLRDSDMVGGWNNRAMTE